MEAEDLATLPFTVPPPEPRAKKRKVEDHLDQLELPPVQPLPKIVDSSVPKPPAPKPQLAEVWKSRAAQKQERVAFAQPTSLTAQVQGLPHAVDGPAALPGRERPHARGRIRPA